MSGELSPDVVARAKAALEGVTEGPWEMRDSFVYPLSISARLGGIRPGDAEFIAAARSLVPELVAEVEQLREYIELNVGSDGGFL